MAKISVIIPAFNAARTIFGSVRSVLYQTFPDFEIIVVDDGSEDATFKIASSVRDPRIKVFSTINKGLSAARNYGMRNASGKFIYFLDADDWIEPNLLEEALYILENENLDFVVWGYHKDCIDKRERLVSSYEVLPGDVTIRRGFGREPIDGNHLDLIGYAWNKLYRTSFLNNYNLRFEEGTSLIEDILFNSEVIRHSSLIRFVNSSYSHYVSRPGISLIKTFRPDAFKLMKRRKAVLESWVVPWKLKNGRETVSYSFIGGIRYCMFNLFENENDLSFPEKVEITKKMFNDPLTRKCIKRFVPDSKDLAVLKYQIVNKLPLEACLEILKEQSRKKETQLNRHTENKTLT
ncbi:MAG: glycosyltransferase family 2 protein [Chitinophagaceae bacterium]|nr:glycosyltransferase family 2 protein [Chitinophagaceae bacterium]